MSEGPLFPEALGEGRTTANLEGFAPDFSYRISDAEALPVLFDLPELAEYRATIHSGEALSSLRLEVEPVIGALAEPLVDKVEKLIREKFLFRAEVEAVPAGFLPRADLKALFPQPVEAVRLEIGFGGGEHLLMRMRESPRIGFIGLEPFANGLAKLLAVSGKGGATNFRVLV